MSHPLNVPPTKNSLLNLKKQVILLEQGYTLLEQKRELLTRLVYERIGSYRSRRKEAKELLKSAYYWLSLAQMRMSSNGIQQVTLGTEAAVGLKLFPRRSLGVQYPAIESDVLPLKPVGLLGTDASIDEVRQKLRDAVIALAKLSEIKTVLGRLIDEQRKAQKRVNALKYNVIPRYQTTIHKIESILEEEERNTLYQIKVLRRNSEKNGLTR